MYKLHHLLMTGTILSGVACLPAHASQAVDGAPRLNPVAMKLAQGRPDPAAAPAEEPRKGAPAQAPAAPPGKPAAPPPAARPAPPPPPAARPTPPPPPTVSRPVPPPPPAAARPNVPPAVQNAPALRGERPEPGERPALRGRDGTPPVRNQPAVQGTPLPDSKPAAPGPTPSAPATQSQQAPSGPPPVRGRDGRPSGGQPPAVVGKPVAPPPAAQGAPIAPAAPAIQGTPVAPAAQAPAAQGAPALAPNTQSAPLTASGTPTATPQNTRPIAPAAAGSGLAPQSAQGRALRRMDDLRGERRETREGNQTIIREPDRTIIREGNQTIIRHNETDRFRYGARDVRVERRGNDNLTTVIRPNGDRIVTTVDKDGFLLRRSRYGRDGREIIIIDNRPRPGFVRGRGFGGYIVNLAPPVIRIPRERYIVDMDGADPRLVYDTLMAPPVELIERPYSLDEIRYTAPLRDRMPRIDLNTVVFETGSWELAPDQIDRLAGIAEGLNRAIAQNPQEVFLIEGHTDAVGADVDNLSLSDRRAESVALALTQQFNVPAENLSTQGYGEQYLKVQTEGPEQANRRVAVRRITPLLSGKAQ